MLKSELLLSRCLWNFFLGVSYRIDLFELYFVDVTYLTYQSRSRLIVTRVFLPNTLHFLSHSPIFRIHQLIVNLIEFLHSFPHLLLITATRWLITGMQSKILNRVNIFHDFTDRIWVQSSIYDVLDLCAKSSVSTEVKRPLYFVQCQFILTVVKIHQRLQYMRFWIVLSVFYRTLNIQLPSGPSSSHQIQTGKTAAQIVECFHHLPRIELQWEQIEIGHVAEVVVRDGSIKVLYRVFHLTQLGME